MQLKNYCPTGSEVLLKYTKQEKLGSILIPEEHQKVQKIMEVIKVGSLVKKELKPGQKVVVGALGNNVTHLDMEGDNLIQVPIFVIKGYWTEDKKKKVADEPTKNSP